MTGRKRGATVGLPGRVFSRMSRQHGRTSRPWHPALWLFLLSVLTSGSAQAIPPPPPPAEWLDLDGYMRARGGLFVNHDLDRGSTATTGEPIFPIPPSGGQVIGAVDMRLRLDLGIHIGDVVTVHARVDALDNLLLGSTPEGFPRTRWTPTAWASTGQEAPAAGVNAFADSIRLKRAYGQVLTPIGLFTVGRMGLPCWGLGVVAAGADRLDDDFDDDVDRVAFISRFREHFVGLAFDLNAIGPTSATSAGTSTRRAVDLEFHDNVYTLSAVLGRDTPGHAIRRRALAGKATFDYGLYATYRWQRAEFPAYYLLGLPGEDESWTTEDAVRRDLRAFAVDLWFRLHVGRVRLELEGAYLRSRVGNASLDAGIDIPPISSSQAGGAFQVEVAAVRGKLDVQLEVGLASGDDAPGLGVAPPLDQLGSQAGDLDGPQFHIDDDLTINNFRFHPNKVIDVVFWRQIVGVVTDALYARAEVTWHASPRFDLTLAGIPSLAVRPQSTPNQQAFYGAEVDLHTRWNPVAGFQLWGDLGLFLPGHALDNPQQKLRAKPAFGAHLTVAFEY